MKILEFIDDCILTAIKALIGYLLINLGLALLVGLGILIVTLFTD